MERAGQAKGAEEAYRGLKELQAVSWPGVFRTGVTRMVVNCAIGLVRKSSRGVSLEDAAPEAEAVSDEQLRCEDTLDLYDALDILPERDRTCITLRFFEELPFADIARILGEPETTVKTRVYRALRKLRAYLEEGDQK